MKQKSAKGLAKKILFPLGKIVLHGRSFPVPKDPKSYLKVVDPQFEELEIVRLWSKKNYRLLQFDLTKNHDFKKSVNQYLLQAFPKNKI